MTVYLRLKHLAASLLAVPLVLFASGGHAFAAAYGCGGYGAGSYNENCPAAPADDTPSDQGTTPSETTPDETSTDTGDTILLNDFEEYPTPEGKTLELKVKQVVHFNVTKDATVQEHSAVIKKIGKDYVIVTFASTPTDVRINVGQTVRRDVTDDGIPDIEATLNSISGGVANITFKQLGSVDTPLPSAASTKSSSTWRVGLLIVSILLVLLIIFWLMRRRRASNQAGPY